MAPEGLTFTGFKNLLSQTPVSFVAVERSTVSQNFYSLIIDYTAKSLEI
ncbi:MAG: hypothetical protein OCU20_04680 [Methanophagales archaeon]|nr:hypothetical protein [Methanophagales archaeon]